MGCVQEQDLNIIDERVLRTIRRMAHFAPSPDWEKPLGKAVLMFSDQQIVTGIALLASGYSQLPRGLDAYHWQIVVYLAWFSSFTHLTTLTVLRNYFQEHPATRLWRIIFMVVTVSLLGIALLPTGNQWWLYRYINSDHNNILDANRIDAIYRVDALGVPALCFFQGRNFNKQIFGLSPSTQAPSMIISILVLFFGYVTRMVKLWPSTSKFTKRWLRVKPGDTIKKILRVSHARSKQSNANACWALNYLVFEMIYVSALAYLVILESMLWEILWLCFALAWGTIHLFTARNYLSEDTTVESAEQVWSFGQFLPVILLILPILSIAEDCYEAWRKKHNSKDTTGGPKVSADKLITNHNETINGSNNTNTSIEPSGAANNGRHDPPQQQHPQIIRIGVWPLGTFTGLSTENVEMTEPRAIPRTGTSISLEEREVETSPRNHLANNSGSAPNSQEVQRLEWFMILVVLLALVICEAIIYVLAFESGGDVSIVDLYQRIIASLLTLGFYTTVYIGFFVVLTEYHSAIGAFLEKHLYFRRQYQRRCLRVFAYLCAMCIVVRIEFVLFGYVVTYLWIFSFL